MISGNTLNLLIEIVYNHICHNIIYYHELIEIFAYTIKDCNYVWKMLIISLFAQV